MWIEKRITYLKITGFLMDSHLWESFKNKLTISEKYVRELKKKKNYDKRTREFMHRSSRKISFSYTLTYSGDYQLLTEIAHQVALSFCFLQNFWDRQISAFIVWNGTKFYVKETYSKR